MPRNSPLLTDYALDDKRLIRLALMEGGLRFTELEERTAIPHPTLHRKVRRGCEEGWLYQIYGRYHLNGDPRTEERPSLGYDFIEEPARRIRDAMLELSYLWGRPLQEINSYYGRVGLDKMAHEIEAARQGKEIHEVLDGKRPDISYVAARCREMRLSLGDYEVEKALQLIESSNDA